MPKYICSILLISVVMLSGCSTPKQTINPQLRIINLPPLGEERTSELGETLVQKGKFYTYEGIQLENTVSAGGGFFLKKYTLSPGTLIANMFDDKRTYYTTNKLEVFDAMIGAQMRLGGLAISKTNEKDVKFHSNGILVLTPEPVPIFSKIQITDVERPNYRQELIYNGRSGDTLKFLYREYSTDIVRAPFSQDVQYDLKDGNIIGFKGVRLEVIDATNIKLKYRVLASFPDAL